MRVARKRVFSISVNGQQEWKEDAGNRTVLETQHQLATESFPGSSVRVRELYLGGAKARLVAEDEEDD